MYRIGLPGWKIAAKAGLPLSFRVRLHKDEESGTFWAESDDLDGLIVSAPTLEELHKEVGGAAMGLLELQLRRKPARTIADFQVSVMPA